MNRRKRLRVFQALNNSGMKKRLHYKRKEDRTGSRLSLISVNSSKQSKVEQLTTFSVTLDSIESIKIPDNYVKEIFLCYVVLGLFFSCYKRFFLDIWITGEFVLVQIQFPNVQFSFPFSKHSFPMKFATIASKSDAFVELWECITC